ncbi:MAG: hypothetical protein IPL11_03825 [Candidatus Accumulibacter sp.]|nr:hypothetical protein [Accumulibacter sp.]
MKHVCYDTLLAANFVLPERRSSLDLLIMPHNRYHAWTIDLIKEDLWRRAVNFAVVSPLPYYRDEGVEDYCKTHGLPCLRLGDVTRLELSFAGLAVFNDWDKSWPTRWCPLPTRKA